MRVAYSVFVDTKYFEVLLYIITTRIQAVMAALHAVAIIGYF